jgi:hypothetical protein
LSGIVVFAGTYSFQVLASNLKFGQSNVIKSLIGLVIVLLAWGAQAGVLRNMVHTHMRQIDFMRSALLAKAPAAYQNVIVVLPSRYGCVTEPCGPWMGRVTDDEWHLSRTGAYRYALANIGASPTEKRITFVKQRPAITPDNSVIVDWEQYSSAQLIYLNSPR